MKKGGLSAGDVAAQYKYKNTLVDVKLDTESNVRSCDYLTYMKTEVAKFLTFKYHKLIVIYSIGRLQQL